MAEGLNVLAFKLDQVVQTQERTDKKVSILADKILNPEFGLSSKVQTNSINNSRNREDIDELYERIENLLSVCESHEKSVSSIEGWMKNHEERDSELRKSVTILADSITKKFEEQDKQFKPIQLEYIVRTSNKIWKDKVIWLIISALITALALPPAIKAIKNSYQNGDTIELKDKSSE
jgi:hypothetical protein